MNMLGLENTDWFEDQQQTLLEPVAMRIPQFMFGYALVFLGLPFGFWIGGL